MIRRWRALLPCVLLAAPGSAAAHSPIEGINNFYNGLLHPLFVPAHLLLLAALGLFFGQQGPKEKQGALILFFGSTVLGLAAAWFYPGGDLESLLLAAAAVIGLLIAANLKVALSWCSLVAGLPGFALGLDSAQETLPGREKLVSFFGSAVGIYLLFLYALGFADYFKKYRWQKIGVRVMGSWVAASSLLALALALAPAGA